MEDDLDVLDLRRRTVNELAASDRGVVHHVLFRLGVAPVDQLILRERRIERDVEQAALSARINLGKARHWFRHRLAIGTDHTQAARTLCDEHLAVWQERHAPRVDEPFGHRDDVEGDTELLLGRTRLSGECRLLIRGVRRALVQPVLGSASGRAATATAGGRTEPVGDPAARQDTTWNLGQGRLPPQTRSFSSSSPF